MEKIMKGKMSITGLVVPFLCWGIFILADYIDEKVLHDQYVVNSYVVYLLPLVLMIAYIVFIIKVRPSVRDVILWHIFFYVSASLLSWRICDAVNYNRWFIEQRATGALMDANGFEYFVFPVVIFGGFLLGSIIFHICYPFIKKRLLDK